MLLQAARRFLSTCSSIEASLTATQHARTAHSSSNAAATAAVTEELQLLQIKFKRLYASLRFTMQRETHLWYSSLNAVLANIDAAEVRGVLTALLTAGA
jgi:hypothetical protein